jgi:hypothetical protein
VSVQDKTNLLPGFAPRDEWVAEVFGKCARTAKRWEDQGLIVVRRFGRQPFVDLEATARRARGEDRPPRKRRRLAQSEAD